MLHNESASLPLRRQHRDVTLAALTFAGIAFALQQTMIIPALPELQRDLGTTTAWATWLLTGFLLVASVATPVLGKLGDQYGKERMLLIAMSVFFVGSVAAIFAPGIATLILCRAVQGVGGAVFPLSFSIIKDEFPADKVGVAVGVVSSVFAVGGGLGLVLSGLIVDNASWRWLFVVGAIGVGIAVVLIHRYVPESPIKTPSRVDVPGAVLLSTALVALLLALTEGESWGWTSAGILGLFALSAAAFVVWGVVETRVPEPLVDMRMLAHRTVLLTNVTGLIVGFAMFGAFVLIPNFAEMPSGLPDSIAGLVDYGFGASTTQAGLYLLPGSLAGFASGPAAGVLARRYGAKWPLALGMAATTVAIGMFAMWHERPLHIVLGMIVLGAGVPLAFAAMAMLIMSAVRPSETGIATGMNTVMRTVGGVVGGQIGAAILSADTIAGTEIPAESAFTTAFWVYGAGSLVGTLVALAITSGFRPRRLVPAVAEAE